jgi:hypothetical protein
MTAFLLALALAAAPEQQFSSKGDGWASYSPSGVLGWSADHHAVAVFVGTGDAAELLFNGKMGVFDCERPHKLGRVFAGIRLVRADGSLKEFTLQSIDPCVSQEEVARRVVAVKAALASEGIGTEKGSRVLFHQPVKRGGVLRLVPQDDALPFTIEVKGDATTATVSVNGPAPIVENTYAFARGEDSVVVTPGGFLSPDGSRALLYLDAEPAGIRGPTNPVSSWLGRFPVPPHATQPAAELHTWGATTHIELAGVWRDLALFRVFDQRQPEVVTKCAGYLDGQGNVFSGGLSLVLASPRHEAVSLGTAGAIASSDDSRIGYRAIDGWRIQDDPSAGAPCTPLEVAKRRLTAAKAAVAELGLKLPQKPTTSPLVQTDGGWTVDGTTWAFPDSFHLSLEDPFPEPGAWTTSHLGFSPPEQKVIFVVQVQSKGTTTRARFVTASTRKK